MTDRVELVTKKTEEGEFTGIRFYLELPVTPTGNAEEYQIKGPFIHKVGDDDSAAVTFWGKEELKKALLKALELLECHVLVNPDIEEKPKAMDFSGWVGHRARMANGKTVEITEVTDIPSLGRLLHGHLEHSSPIQGFTWRLEDGKHKGGQMIAEYDLVELLDGPTKNKKGE
jgi:hypothetical protein